MNQDIEEIVIAAIFAFVAGWFGLWNALIEMEVLDLVNAKLPPNKQYPVLWGIIAISSFGASIRAFFPAAACYEKPTG